MINKTIKFGGPATPIPTYDPKTGHVGALCSYRSEINFVTFRDDISRSGSMQIQGDDDRITANEALYADLIRNLPSRQMLPHLIHELTERDPTRTDWNKRSMVCRYEGPPSIGKSFLIKALGKLTHPKGVLYLNCKDVDMGVLFCETVFDTSAANTEKAAIDARVLQGNAGSEGGLKPESRILLKQILGSAYIEDELGDSVLTSIDWNGIQVKGNSIEEQAYQEQVVREAIKQVCELEGIRTNSGLSQIGITTRDGMAVRAADPTSADYCRPILLDELMRCKHGTDQKLFEWVAMLSDPLVDYVEVIAGKNRHVRLYRRDLPATYRVNITDNPNVRGMGSASMSKPLKSRLGFELDDRIVPDPGLPDYADRIAQFLTGFGALQVYYAGKEFFDAHPSSLRQLATNYLRAGKTDAAISRISNEDLTNIENIESVIELSEQLGRFFADLKPMFNPNSTFHQQQGTSVSHAYEDYLSSVEIDLRLVTKLLEKALTDAPIPSSPAKANFSSAFQFGIDSGKSAKAEPAPNRGLRLENYIVGWLERVFVPADADLRGINKDECKKLLDIALKAAANCGIGDPELREADKGDVKRICDLYDFNPYAGPMGTLLVVRDIVVGKVREQYAELQEANDQLPNLPEDNEKILSTLELEQALDHVARLENISRANQPSSIVLPNFNPDDFMASPFSACIVNDTAQAGAGMTDTPIDKDALLIGLAHPKLRDQSVAALFSKTLVSRADLAQSDPAIQVSAKQSDTGFGLTSCKVLNGDTEETLHLFSAKDGALLVVGGQINEMTANLLRACRVTYAERGSANAERVIDGWAEGAFKQQDVLSSRAETDALLKRAFILRNGNAGDEEALLALPLPELVFNEKSVPIRPVVVIHQNANRALAAMSRG